MKRSLFLVAALFFLPGRIADAGEIILSVNFNDPSQFTVGGGGAAYWGVAPLAGTSAFPSSFVQGGSQAGDIFYGAYAKDSSNSAATMTILLGDLSGYTDLVLTVALAAPDGDRWENSHRDSLNIIGGTTTTPPFVDCSILAGCQPISGAIDSFLPAGYGAPLQSQVYSVQLQPQFQDFQYALDNGLKSITFAFASSAGDEVIGIDSVTITGSCSDFPGGGHTGGCFPGPGPFPVPEPGSTLLLLSTGLIGLGWARRKLRQ